MLSETKDDMCKYATETTEVGSRGIIYILYILLKRIVCAVCLSAVVSKSNEQKVCVVYHHIYIYIYIYNILFDGWYIPDHMWHVAYHIICTICRI
jgi:hypothetical protein